MYPMALMCLYPFGHYLEKHRPVPNPILESHESHSVPPLLTIPILTLEFWFWLQKTLNPSLLQLFWNEAWVPINSFHFSRPIDWRSIGHQQSVSGESPPACRWQWTWAVGWSSYRDRSWRRMCSSRWVALIPVRRTQSPLREDCSLDHLSSNAHHNGRWSEK